MVDKTETLKSKPDSSVEEILREFPQGEEVLEESLFDLAAATIDEAEAPDETELKEVNDEVELDLSVPKGVSTDDPVRMYLREIGTIPLLNGKQEVALAKAIVAGGPDSDRAKRKLA